MAVKSRIGVAVHTTGARVVLHRGDTIDFAKAVVFNAADLRPTLSKVLCECRDVAPAVRSVSIAMAPSLMPVKVVQASDVSRRGEYSAIVPRFFVCVDSVHLTISTARADERMISVISAAVSRAVHDAVSDAGMRARGIVPVALAIESHAGLHGAFFQDGDHAVTVLLRGPRLPRTRRSRSAEIQPPEACREIRGDDASTWFDALGASKAVSARFCVFKDMDAAKIRRHAGRRWGQGAAAFSLLIAGLAPMLTRAERIREYERYLDTQTTLTRLLERETALVGELTEEVEQLLRFRRAQAPMTIRLGELAQALPPHVHATAAQLDSTELQVTVRGKDVGHVPASLARATGCANASVVGPISHELSPAGAVQRALIACRSVKSPLSGKDHVEPD